MLSFIQKYISNKRKKAQEELNNKPQYRIGDLYCGEIVLKLNETYIEEGIVHHHHKLIKNFAIFVGAGKHKYLHVKSHKELGLLHWLETKDYCILDDSLQTFENTFPNQMRKQNLTKDTLISFNDICYIEDNLQNNIIEEDEIKTIF